MRAYNSNFLVRKHAFEKSLWWPCFLFSFDSFFIFRIGYVFYTIEPNFAEFVLELFAIQYLKSENNRFLTVLGFLQISVVIETSNIAYVTPLVHTFLGKKIFF